MAQYQREFLTTYLRDASALHFALQQLQERLVALEQQRRSLEKGIHRKEHPISPRYEASNGVFLLVLSAFSFISALSVFLSKLYLFGLFCLILSAMLAIVGVIRYIRVTQENAKKETRYNQKLAAYREVQRKNEQEREAIPAIVSEMQQCQKEIERVWSTLHKVYCTNVIPKRCRNIYATVFLYVWFSEDNPNDMELAIKTFEFERTQKKLDLLLFCQKEILLNRYLKLAQEDALPEQQEMHAAISAGKVDLIDPSAEHYDTYLSMIESDQITTAYFQAADYLLKI